MMAEMDMGPGYRIYLYPTKAMPGFKKPAWLA